jgi:hypothetical protein
MRILLGRVVITSNALNHLVDGDWFVGLTRHSRGDWGDVCREDWNANDLACKEMLRLLSTYRDSAGTRYWIITEADRSATTILLPEDY